MELEEEKPKDIILNKEIKQEMEDFLENVKKEPIEEDECSGLIIPKQESEESFEYFKEERVDEEFSEQAIPKIEEIMEPSALSAQATQTIGSKSEGEPEGSQKELHVEPKKNNTVGDSQYQRCSVCSQNRPLENMQYVTIEEDVLVTMIGCLLRGDYSLAQAQSFMSAGRKVYICYNHFSESITKIYNSLNIKNTIEMSSCSSKLMTKLMITVNALIPQIETSHFCDIVYKFVRRFISRKRKRKRNTKEEQNKGYQNHRCLICTQIQSSKNLKYVSLQDEMLVLMMGCVLRGEYTIETVQSVISERKSSRMCHIHFSQTTDEICKFLNIRHPDEVSLCSTERMENLMITVNKLRPWITASHFCHLFNAFVTRNKKFLDREMPSTKMEFEDQMSKDIFLNGEIKQEPVEKEYLDQNVPKQETEESLENIKTEPIDEENSERIIPKFGEVQEQSTSYVSNNPIQNMYIPKFNVEPRRKSTAQNNNTAPRVRNQRCSVCLKTYLRQNMKDVTMEEEKLVIMVGCVLRDEYTLDQAQSFMSGRERVNICHIHFSEALIEIYKALNIKNPDEVSSCSEELMAILMATVNKLCPLVEPWQFRTSLNKFFTKNKHIIQTLQ